MEHGCGRDDVLNLALVATGTARGVMQSVRGEGVISELLAPRATDLPATTMTPASGALSVELSSLAPGELDPSKYCTAGSRLE